MRCFALFFPINTPKGNTIHSLLAAFELLSKEQSLILISWMYTDILLREYKCEIQLAQ